ncbi:MAG: hypothetical protein ABL883_12215 [Terricaulis sp.]
MLADLIANDEEGAEWFRGDLRKLDGVLAKAGLAAHIEPVEGAVHSASTYGYSGLHYLRRCAAHLQYNGHLPPPLAPKEQAMHDPVYTRYSAEFVDENDGVEPGALAKPSSRRFDHLLMHSDAEGFYVPQDFDRVVIAGDESYGWVGSSHALRNECVRLAAVLELPNDLLADYESERFHEAIETARRGNKSWSLFKSRPASRAAWEQHPIAAMLCAKLHGFSEHSINAGSLLVFC